ncbi:MAG TPA: RidA family protein [Beijerinckiaceae bacterium]|nr:RidA family protein [Beijerinckiaceae bacterium]
MTRQLISTGSPFEKAYGYSRAVAQGPFVFVSGTTGYDYATMTMPADVAEQARNCWRTIETVLTDAGASLEDIVRATYYVTSPADAVPVLEVCGEVLAEIRPAAAMLIVSALLKPEMKVEIEVTAMKREA